MGIRLGAENGRSVNLLSSSLCTSQTMLDNFKVLGVCNHHLEEFPSLVIVIDSEFVHHKNAQFLLAFKYGQGDDLSQLIFVANTWMWKILCISIANLQRPYAGESAWL